MNIHAKILNRFDCLYELDLLNDSANRDQIDAIMTDYSIACNGIMNNTACNGVEVYNQLVVTHDIKSRIHAIYTKLHDLPGSGTRNTFTYVNDSRDLSGIAISDVIGLIKQIYQSNDFVVERRAQAIACICGNEIKLSFLNEVVCECGIINKVMVDQDSLSVALPAKIKSSKAECADHCRTWLGNIQGKIMIDIPPEFRAKLLSKAANTYTKSGKLQSMAHLSCGVVRSWIKELGSEYTTKWNKYAPYLRRIITANFGESVIPPQLTEHEEQTIIFQTVLDMDYYDVVIKEPELLSRLEKTRIVNKYYYPFVLLRNILAILKKDSRVLGLVDCIHMQSSQTLVKNDTIYERICELRKRSYAPTEELIRGLRKSQF